MERQPYTLVTTEPTGQDQPSVDVYTFDIGVTEAGALACLDYPYGARCQHAHDCCGNWYPRPPAISYVNGRLTITQRWYQNI